MKVFFIIVSALSWATSAVSRVLLTSAALEDLFQLKSGTGKEVCAGSQRDLTRSWLADISELTSTVLNGFANPSSDIVLLNNLETFLGIPATFVGAVPVVEQSNEGRLDTVRGT